MNWDDLKYFLAVCRASSIRQAAVMLNVNHATVSRRLKNFELSIGDQLFDRTPQGYVCTKLGQEIYQEAEHLENTLSSVERKVVGRDHRLEGEIRVTLPDVLAQNLLMPGFAEFVEEYPDVQFEIIDSTKLLNLANREADVAFRLCKEPPDYLVGRRLATIHRACYMARKLLPNLEKADWLENQSWLGWSDKQRRPVGTFAKTYPRFGSKHKIISGVLQTQACMNGMGIAILPCFWADNNPELVRIPPYQTEAKYDLWVLNHPDLRGNLKIQTFVRFMTAFITSKLDLITGKSYKI